jgi:hypothetical protein
MTMNRTKRNKIYACASLLLILSVVHAQQQTAPANTETTRASADSGLVVSYTSELTPIVINKIHNWIVHLETADGTNVAGAQIVAIGGMPIHDHGLPTLPRMTRELGDGDYLLEGMKFHMNGWWQVTVSIDVNDNRDSVIFDLVL